MKALVKTGKDAAEVKEIERPREKTLVETLRVGIDGTDREVLEDSDEVMGEDYMVMGHEAVGRVVKSDTFEEGDLVVPTVRRPDNKCPSRFEDRPDFCAPGHFSERGIYKAHGFCSQYFSERNSEYLVKIPDNLEEIGVLVEPTSIVVKALDEAFKAQERLHFNPEKAVVLGAGSIGLLASMVLRRKGLEVQTVDIVDEDHTKAEILREIGAEYIDNRETKIEELEADIILEASGVSQQIFKGLKVLGSNGALVSVGLPRQEDLKEEFALGEFHKELVLKNKILLGSVNSSVNHFEEAVDYLNYFQREFPVNRILDTQTSVDKWEKAFEPQIKGEIVFK